jgi:hypothetical protein
VNRLTTSDKALCAVYGLVGLAALIGTQIALVRHITTYEGNDVSGALKNTVANAASTFTVIDLLAVALVGLVFIVAEGRRLQMRFIWVYVVLTFAVAISVALPAFLIARQFSLAAQRTARVG